MSLNHSEIDLVLSELDLAGARVERILQPSYDTIVLGLYAGGRVVDLLVSISHGACRLHSVSSMPARNERPLRFMECLKSRIKGGRIESAGQLGSERIVKIALSVPRAEPGAEKDARPEDPADRRVVFLRYTLYARLWSGAGNVILADETGTIVDVMARKPSRGEMPGLPCRVEEDLAGAGKASSAALSAGTRDDRVLVPAAAQADRAPRVFPVRDLPGEGSFNRRVEMLYASTAGELSRDKLIEKARERYAKRERVLAAHIADLEARLEEYRNADRMREIGDLLMAGYSVPEGSAGTAAGDPGERDRDRAEGTTRRATVGRIAVTVDDFYRGGTLAVRIDPKLSNVENARLYYERYRKASTGLAEVGAEIGKARDSQWKLKNWLAGLEAESDPFRIAKALAKAGTVREKDARKYPGLSLLRSGWTILVGRSAKENDELLRRHVRGSDMWMHARDHAGSYVFVKARAGKTFPLDILLDAGTLALYYSKARPSGQGDLYYTFAKYLRRAKDGPKGLVIPTLEKNMFVRIDAARLAELLDLVDGKETSQ